MEKIILDNGLRILLEPDDNVRTASFGIWVLSGPAYEKQEENGISHFIEHILFKGTTKRSSFQISEEMDFIGGQLNAFTARDFTCFYAKTLTEYIPTAFDILADMITSPRLDEEDIRTECDVILEEIGMCEDDPEDLVYEQLISNVWRGTPYGLPILGTRKTVKAVDREKILSYMKEKYTPSRMVIAICGKYDKDEFVSIAEKYFGDMPEDNSEIKMPEIVYQKQTIITNKDYEQTHFTMALPSYNFRNPKRYAMSLLNTIVGGSSSSRLFQQIREKLGLAYSVFSSYTCHTTGGLFSISAGVNASKLDEAINEVRCVLEDVVNNGVSEKEFLRAKAQNKSLIIMSSEGVQSRLSRMASGELITNEVMGIDEIIEKIDRLTVEDLNEVAKEIFDFNNISLSVVGNS